MSEEVKIDWDKEFPIARAIVNDWDPLVLIQDGGPKESYDFLALKIFSGIKSEQSDQEITENVIQLMKVYYQLPVEEYEEGLRMQVEMVIGEIREELEEEDEDEDND